MVDRMERFTPEARKVLMDAQEEAETFRHGQIGPDHLLLALARSPSRMVQRVLSSLYLSEAAIRRQMDHLPPAPRIAGRGIDLSDNLKKTLELTVDETRRLGQTEIDLPHLLLGIGRLSEEGVTVLQRLSVRPDSLYKAVMAALRDEPPA